MEVLLRHVREVNSRLSFAFGIFASYSKLRMKPQCRYAFQQNILYVPSAVHIVLSTFSYFFQNVLEAPVPLRI